jgi:hypothetical protein
MLLVTFGLGFRKIGETEAVLNFPTNPNLGTKLSNRRLADVLSKHGYFTKVRNVD